MLRAPIFIVGLNKSGTSLLYLLLSRHEALSAIRSYQPPKAENNRGPATLYMENYALGEGQKIPTLIEKLRPGEGSGRWALPQFVERYRLTEADAVPGDAEGAAAAYRSGMIDPERRLCEKSPPNLIRTRYLQALFPDARFVAIVRDPYANVSANGKKRTKWGGVPDQATHWANAHRLFLEDKPRLSRLVEVRYEDLARDPKAVLNEICGMCEIDFDPQSLEGVAIEAAVNDSLVAKLSPDEIETVSAICGPAMGAFGYARRPAAFA